MDVKAYLISQGLNEEDATTIASNPAYAGVYTKLAKEAEDGKTAFMKAQEIEQSMKNWNETQVVPYVQKADRAVADAQAKIAAQSTYLKTLKEQGYDIPDAYLAGDPTIPVVPAKVELTPAKSDEMLNYAKANMALIAMSNKYRKLTGEELDPEAEFTDFSSNARPNENLRTYIDRKYDLGAKQAAIEAQKKTDYEDAIRKDSAAKAIAEYQAKHGSNGETRIPVNSRFDKVAEDRKTAGNGSDKLWQTQAGREQARQNRLQKYSNLIN